MAYDIIIIGAGPAGCSSALHAAREGLRVLVLEEHPAIGEPVHCGECFSKLALERMGWRLPENVISKRVGGVRVIFPGDEKSTLTEEGYVLEKHLFEQWIAEQAKGLGAQIILGKKVKETAKNGTWKITCADGSSFESRLLVDASGPAAITSRLLNLNPRFETVVGLQYEMKGIPDDGFLDFYLWPDLAPHGYLWMIPKSGGRANVGLVTNQNARAKEMLDAFVARKGWDEKEKVKTFGGIIPSSGPVERTYSDGLLLVGDAAGFTSPLFEGGTSLSLMSGKFAAQVAKKALDAGDTSSSALSEYEKLWKAEFPDYSKLVEGKKALYNLNNEQLRVLGKILPKELSQISPLEKAVFALKVLAFHRDLIPRGLFSTLKAFGYSRARNYGW
ncbi:NAD(P)/FAD-dependent oxidoreductase [Candidatus Micrarchaeota archaeon]|nr:NAD(P)/FAD-dependent oxidoreductase [Candidatus Micrarchaeota archaeon]